MAAIFVDLDGVLFAYGTQELVPGAVEALKRFAAGGNQLIFTTRREYNWPGSPEAADILDRLFPDYQILWGITSPRILINDEGAVAINHPADQPWHYNLNQIAKQMVENF
jgi:hypothetical protein